MTDETLRSAMLINRNLTILCVFTSTLALGGLIIAYHAIREAAKLRELLLQRKKRRDHRKMTPQQELEEDERVNREVVARKGSL